MRYNPKNPYSFNRDRFVLSAGHGCMLQYALLHLAGYDSVKVRQLDSWFTARSHPFQCLHLCLACGKMERFAPIIGFAEAVVAIMEEPKRMPPTCCHQDARENASKE